MTEKLYDAWAKRNPYFEIRYKDNIVEKFTDYGKGVTNLGSAKGKLFGAGYEMLIIAFFIGLYHNQRKKLNEDSSKTKQQSSSQHFTTAYEGFSLGTFSVNRWNFFIFNPIMQCF